MYNHKIRNLAIVAVAAMLLAAAASSVTASQNILAYDKNQAKSDVNSCGNGELPTNIGCQNTDCQIQGEENSCALASQQTFPAAEPVPPPEVGCPDDTVWDITIREQAGGEVLPVGTVICLIQGLGNHPAVVIPPGQEPFEASVNTDQPNVANCNGLGQQVAQVTSGNPPNPLSMGSFLCATPTG